MQGGQIFSLRPSILRSLFAFSASFCHPSILEFGFRSYGVVGKALVVPGRAKNHWDQRV